MSLAPAGKPERERGARREKGQEGGRKARREGDREGEHMSAEMGGSNTWNGGKCTGTVISLTFEFQLCTQ